MKYVYQAGDTIIEVFIAMAVLGVVLAGAFAATNRSLINIYRAHERIEALKLVEGQVESLDILSKGSTQATMGSSSNIFGAVKIFCLDSSNVVTTANSGTGVDFGAMPSLDTDSSFGSYLPACNAGTNSRYHLAIERSDDPTMPKTGSIFTVHARWDSAGGITSGTGGHDEVTIRYKLDRPLP